MKKENRIQVIINGIIFLVFGASRVDLVKGRGYKNKSEQKKFLAHPLTQPVSNVYAHIHVGAFIQNTLLLEGCNAFQFIQSKRHIFISVQQSPFIDNVRPIFEVGISWFDYKSNNDVYFDVFIPLGENANNPAQMEYWTLECIETLQYLNFEFVVFWVFSDQWNKCISWFILMIQCVANSLIIWSGLILG